MISKRKYIYFWPSLSDIITFSHQQANKTKSYINFLKIRVNGTYLTYLTVLFFFYGKLFKNIDENNKCDRIENENQKRNL